MKTLPTIPPLRGLLAGARRTRHAVPKIITSIPALAAFLILVAATFSLISLGPFQWPPTTSSSSPLSGAAPCDLTRGRWVRDPSVQPYYTNATCAFIEGYQNCMKHGRPSLEFLQWRWRPAGGAGCDDGDLPRFDAARFFELLRGKSILFVGDSLASSHVRSLVCTLSQVEPPARSPAAGGFERWRFPAHGLTVTFFWTPFQVRWRLTRGPPEPVGPDRQGEVFAGPSDIHLDEPDARWLPAAAREHDIVVVSASHWFARAAVHYRRAASAGRGGAASSNATAAARLTPEQAQRAAFRTVLRGLAGMEGWEGTAVLRTVAPTHYENGGWFDGGECTATEPADPEDPVPEMAGTEREFYRAQVEEFAAAQEEVARRSGVRMRLMDVTGMMLRRPDGHPDRYGHGGGEHEGFDIDCLHWCLPGPIDVWNELLLQILAGR
ncbi:unnamed protein product [Urochloa decumbens]|uniref:Trichome birefringence-like N-terminal domain-containing protein n=1 Tax=Urochloa decumbens TaxID=240449 RepID=A0ABC9DR55_9POAL